MLNDDEIVTSVQAESDPVDDETDEDEDNTNESSEGSSNAGLFSAVRFYILHRSHSVFGYPNNHVSERCPVPIDSDKRRSTAHKQCPKNCTCTIHSLREKYQKESMTCIRHINSSIRRYL
ncbi:hypothetical protein TNCV_3081411 [Trichonephila clavipes]|nr:hypothetical protein TNCV_3081411 [Trichonephila clavipes]